MWSVARLFLISLSKRLLCCSMIYIWRTRGGNSWRLSIADDTTAPESYRKQKIRMTQLMLKSYHNNIKMWFLIRKGVIQSLMLNIIHREYYCHSLIVKWVAVHKCCYECNQFSSYLFFQQVMDLPLGPQAMPK